MGGGGVQRVLKFLKFWDYRKFDVSVVTVKPSHFYAEDRELTAEIPSSVEVIPSGSLDPFRLLYLFRKIFRIPPRKSRKLRRESAGILRRAAGYLFLPDSRVLWLPFAVAKIGNLHRRKPIDLLIATVPPFTAGLIGTVARRFFRIPYILDFRDAWSNNPYLPEQPAVLRKLQSGLEKRALLNSAGVVFVNPNLQNYYLKRYDFLEEIPTVTIRNGFDPDDFPTQVNLSERHEPDKFRIGVVGTIYSQGNAPFPLLRAVADLVRKQPELRNRLRIVFMGKWAKDFLSRVREFGIDDLLEWINYLPHRQALAYANGFDALALSITDSLPGSENVTPGRIYEYLYLRKPILAICPPESDLARLVKNNRAGVVVPYSNTSAVREVLEKWISNPARIDHPPRNASHMDSYHRGHLTRQLINFIEERVIRGSNAPPRGKFEIE